jgi:hypothetical protein
MSAQAIRLKNPRNLRSLSKLVPSSWKNSRLHRCTSLHQLVDRKKCSVPRWSQPSLNAPNWRPVSNYRWIPALRWKYRNQIDHYNRRRTNSSSIYLSARTSANLSVKNWPQLLPNCTHHLDTNRSTRISSLSTKRCSRRLRFWPVALSTSSKTTVNQWRLLEPSSVSL